MQINKQAFTLIELLVVVLIIGILAAVAVPQYQRAVLKSQVATVLAVGRSVRDAQNTFYLLNADYATSMQALDVEVSCPVGWVCSFNDKVYSIVHESGRFGINFSYATRRGNVELANIIYCWANKNNNDMYLNICKSYGPDMKGNSERYMAQIGQ